MRRSAIGEESRHQQVRGVKPANALTCRGATVGVVLHNHEDLLEGAGRSFTSSRSREEESCCYAVCHGGMKRSFKSPPYMHLVGAASPLTRREVEEIIVSQPCCSVDILPLAVSPSTAGNLTEPHPFLLLVVKWRVEVALLPRDAAVNLAESRQVVAKALLVAIILPRSYLHAAAMNKNKEWFHLLVMYMQLHFVRHRQSLKPSC